MKNLFSFNVQTQEQTYAPYIVRSVSSETTSRQEASDEQIIKKEKESNLPLWLRIVQMSCLLVAVCIFAGLLRAFGENEHDESVSEMWARFVGNGAIAMIAVGVVCLAVFVVLFALGRARSRKVQASPEYTSVMNEHDKMKADSYEELCVPADADDIDVFCHPYKYTRKGKEKWGMPAQYIAICYKIFKDDEDIYFADTAGVIKIPLTAVGGVNVINKRSSFIGWNKDVKPNSPEYKPYKITANNMGILFIKWCFSVNVVLNGEEYEIVIPPFENEILRKYVDIEQGADTAVEMTENHTEEAKEQLPEQVIDDSIEE